MEATGGLYHTRTAKTGLSVTERFFIRGNFCSGRCRTSAKSDYHLSRITGLEKMLSLLKIHGYSRVSLSVQKANFAVNLYQKVGFEIVKENAEEYIMVRCL